MASGPRIVFPRARAQLLILGAAFTAILLATTVLAVVTSYLSAVTDSSLRSAVRSAPPQDIGTEVRGEVSAENYRAADDALEQALLESYAGLNTPIWSSLVSRSYALPAGVGTAGSLTVLSAYEDLPAHATLTAGGWPAAGGAAGDSSSPIEVALLDGAASALGVQPGSVLQLSPRRTGPTRDVVVVGLFTVDDAADPFWFDQQLETQGSRRLTFTTYGPMVTSMESFLASVNGADTVGRWRVAIDADRLDASSLDDLRTSVATLEQDVQAREAVDELVVTTNLPTFLATVERSLLVARSTILVPVVQVVVLGVTALLLTARLLSEHRRTESALLRARGVSTRQLVTTAIREGLVLALPAALLAPVLADLVLRAIDGSPAFREIGLIVDEGPSWPQILVAIVAALGCSAALVVPSLRRALTYVESHVQQGRQSRRVAVQRAGFDLSLVFVAMLALWQLREYESPIQQDTRGRLGIDPLLVAAPALALLAGAVLSLRLLPRLSRFGERVAAPTRGLGAALGAWEIHRRPLRYGWPTLLLVLAFAVGALSLAFTSTWQSSQRDQAAYRAGADLRVTTPLRGDAVPAGQLPAAYAELPGVATVVSVHRARITLSETAELFAIGQPSTGDAGDILAFRPDLADVPIRDLLDRAARADGHAGSARPARQRRPPRRHRVGVEQCGAPDRRSDRRGARRERRRDASPARRHSDGGDVDELLGHASHGTLATGFSSD